MLLRERPCQDSAASAPWWRPQRPKRKSGITDLIVGKPDESSSPGLSPREPRLRHTGRGSLRHQPRQGVRANDYSAERRHRDSSCTSGLQFCARHSITAEAMAKALQAVSSLKVVDYPLAPSSRDDSPRRACSPAPLLSVILGKQVRAPAAQSCREIEISFFG